MKDYISRNESKVVLLTATPYNVDFSDAANQLALFVDEDASLGIAPDHAMRRTDTAEFLQKCDEKPQTLKAFRLSEEREDWQRLMSLFLVRRTRRFITDNYALTDEAGRKYLNFAGGGRFHFPERTAKPIPHLLERDDPAAAMVSERTLDALANLRSGCGLGGDGDLFPVLFLWVFAFPAVDVSGCEDAALVPVASAYGYIGAS